MSGAPEIRALGAPAATLGEGPSCDPLTGVVTWFDILGKTLYEHDPEAGTTRTHALPMRCSALAAVDAERQLVVSEAGLFLRDRASGALSLHRPLEADRPDTRSNDSRTHPSGAFWIGTMGIDAAPGAGAIYWYRAGEIRRLFDAITVPNAICFSPDGRTGYFTDTPTGIINRVALDPATGLPVGAPDPFDTGHGRGEPDGAVVDADGCLWVARWDGGCLEHLSPEGALIATIDLPVTRPTCPVFFGAGAGRMILTSAREGLGPDALAATPQAGCSFEIRLATPFSGKLDAPVALAP
ncbi:SMP-30/gluconolactonase/LRE family protein (plasmid) [Paroceanicella profunda]|uniref:SMP-30/gluconolactonase/LRE family protein n=1 Tax=Paroceanicella profunda TaxID=2579971 RepID=A0A5B8G4Y1_9RHOB|nr:SMP-30/gluconolactonase/LRE family protein [Paroceanicella profunda]QDL94053.1 SMP-30/gluconolactonase/LRE family protein [Paroceanicella profunda]